jgi:serine/threonine protein kinase
MQNIFLYCLDVTYFYSGEMFDYIVSLHRVPEREACIFFHQIIDGVEALHNNFVTHRDLKPEVR